MRLITGAVKEINRLGKLGLFQTHMQDLHLIWGIRGGNAKNKSSGRSYHLTREFSGLGKYPPEKEKSPAAGDWGFSGKLR
jgi:hypothetical protein